MVGPSQTANASVGTSGTSIELQPIGGTSNSHTITQAQDNIDPAEFLPQPSTTVTVVERWNSPKVNVYRLGATLFAFTIIGANDAAYGALIPYLEEYYNLTYVVVSLVFLSPLAGYVGAALLNNFIHIRFGQRGVAFIGPCCHLFAYLGIALHPPYPVLVVVFILAGFGNGLQDAAWNAWVGNMANSNEVLGFLHGFYGLGAILSPLAITSLITKVEWPWYAFYYIMIGGAVLELVTSLWAFWPVSGTVYRNSRPRTVAGKNSRLKESLTKRPTWVVSFFLLCYVGLEVALGGWIVTFMRRERAGLLFESGMVATGFWAGIVSGRFILGFLTPKLGEKIAVVIYIISSIVCQLIFWLVPSFHVSAVFVSIQGFFLGPLFPAAVVAASKTLPSYLHVSAIGFAVAFGGGGAAVLPFAIGGLAQARGVAVLQPVVLAVLCILLVLWVCIPTLQKPSPGNSSESPKPNTQWMNVDFDLVQAGKKMIHRGKNGEDSSVLNPERAATRGIRQRVAERQEAKAEKKYIKKQIRQINLERETPAFAVLQGVDPGTERPPPYQNVAFVRSVPT